MQPELDDAAAERPFGGEVLFPRRIAGPAQPR